MMEAGSVTGPAKNLIGFGRWLKTQEGSATGIRIAVATFDRSPGRAGHNRFVDAVRAAGLDVYVIHERYRFDPSVLRQVRAIAAEVRPDIIQTHNNKSHLLIRWLRELRADRPWLAFHHGDTYTDLKQRLYNQVDRMTLRSADCVVTVCQAFTSRLTAFGVRPERVRILHNAATPIASITDTERDQLRNELGIGIGESVILTTGRLSREKGHADLLKAVSRLRSFPQRWKLVIVGDGPEREALRQLARVLEVERHVAFAGFRTDVERLYGVADLFVLPSHSEGSSNVLLEAMMAKVPIVATRVGGNPEIISNEETGLLVAAADPAGIAQAIDRLLGQPAFASQLAEAAAVRAGREFSIDRYRDSLLRYYAEALGKRESTDALPVGSHCDTPS